jgi:DNA-binding GntR family transcriptional regulator
MAQIVEVMGTSHGIYFHKKLIAAIKAKDKESAVSIMREHLADTEKAMG